MSTVELKSTMRSLTTNENSASSKVMLIADLEEFAENDPEVKAGRPLYVKLICEL